MHRLKAAKYRADVDPRELAIYTPADAASYLGVKPGNPRDLAFMDVGTKREAVANSSSRLSPPQIKRIDYSRSLTLLKAHVLAATRYKHNVSIRAVREAMETLREKYPSPHPLISQDFFTNGKDIFLKKVDENENLSTRGQLNLKPIMDLFFGAH